MQKTRGAIFRPSRRQVLVTGVIVASGVSAWGLWPASGYVGDTLTPVEAHQEARGGRIVLVDIRRPDEWAQTGTAKDAHRLDMRRADFLAELDVLVEGDRSRPVALICARGVRSDRMSQRLTDAGFTNVIDVPEGMLGSSAGPGWLSRDLPVVK
ncbi:rhodanese-like domain-containing protein [Roseovarius aestuarii]|uniref:Molybdopterin biosynthesis protein MoeB n=1 Tax=Roseovarius aestuarii TaxID=475083 RepID=A0A1X7BU18_9RHOB|nr:rhodanese-like domain-containing protein [Roseovarius aestuarii]SMC13127.1 molybdopterin biosynthesis protein MoeB [Roseovarius aestuarii]